MKKTSASRLFKLCIDNACMRIQYPPFMHVCMCSSSSDCYITDTQKKVILLIKCCTNIYHEYSAVFKKHIFFISYAVI